MGLVAEPRGEDGLCADGAQLVGGEALEGVGDARGRGVLAGEVGGELVLGGAQGGEGGGHVGGGELGRGEGHDGEDGVVVEVLADVLVDVDGRDAELGELGGGADALAFGVSEVDEKKGEDSGLLRP